MPSILGVETAAFTFGSASGADELRDENRLDPSHKGKAGLKQQIMHSK
jgi:hypothetical protein